MFGYDSVNYNIMDIQGHKQINMDINRYVTGYPGGHSVNNGYSTGFFDWIITRRTLQIYTVKIHGYTWI